MNSKSKYLFIYGTILNDFETEISKFLSANISYLSKEFFHGKIFLVDQYPGAIITHSLADKVYGSLFKVNDSDAVFNVLDSYEGNENKSPNPSLYKRELVTVNLKNGTFVEAWAYLYNQPIDGLKHINSGDFIEFANNK